MDYNTPLIEGQFLKRYKRFFADVQIGKKIEVAHVPNTGSLRGVCDAPRLCRVSLSSNPARKLKFTLEQVQTDTSWVGVNTHQANDLAWEAFQLKRIPHWQNYTTGTREIKINVETRLDMKFTNKTPGAAVYFVEVKSVTLARQAVALFPDAETTRGQKHLTELMRLRSQGAQTELLFVVQRQDCRSFSPADDIDPEYGRLLRAAATCGVKLTAYVTKFSAKDISLDPKNEIPIVLS